MLGGSKTGISELLDLPNPEEVPQAELWMGAHQNGPSELFHNEKSCTLSDLIQLDPAAVLGRGVANRFKNKLPFLFKVLAAQQPLSIQAHPNLRQAKIGFKKENDQGISPTASNRNYKDDNHKPEIICALTPFFALNGFRPVSEIIDLLEGISCPEIETIRQKLVQGPIQNRLRKSFSRLLLLDEKAIKGSILDLVEVAEKKQSKNPVFQWVLKIQEQFPFDIGVLCSLFLRFVKLNPGEAMFLPAQQLHAYLSGVGIELMANSDNVLRGGLTPKYIDKGELLKVLNFDVNETEILQAKKHGTGFSYYETQAKEFLLSVVSVASGQVFTSEIERSIEIILCTQGIGVIKELSGLESFQVGKGDSFVIPACTKQYEISGDVTVFRASVPVLN